MEIIIDTEKVMKYTFFALLFIAIFMLGMTYSDYTAVREIPQYIVGCKI